jgi:hypothetical protein
MEATNEDLDNLALINTQAIDHLTEEFYKCVSFDLEHFPNTDRLQELFYGSARLIDNRFDKPADLTAHSFSQSLMQQISIGNVTYFAQQEIGDITEIFGTMAQRISVYEYSNKENNTGPWKRGVNYIQYIFIDGKWLITSMIWTDEKEGLKIPEIYLL